MRLQHAEPEQTSTPGGTVRREDLEKITALAARLQEEHRDQLSPEEVEAMGQELGIAPEFMRAAMEQLRTASAEKQVTRPVQQVVTPVRRRNYVASFLVAALCLWLFMVGLYMSRAQTAPPLAPPTPVATGAPR